MEAAAGQVTLTLGLCFPSVCLVSLEAAPEMELREQEAYWGSGVTACGGQDGGSTGQREK